MEEVIKVRCKSNGFGFAKDEIYVVERIITGAYKLINDKGVYHIFFGNDFSSYFEKVTDDVLMVECIDNNAKTLNLTIGKQYPIITNGEYNYELKNDYGLIRTYDKSIFKTVEPPKEEKKEYSVMELLDFEVGTKFKYGEDLYVEIAYTDYSKNNKYIKTFIDKGLVLSSNWLKTKFTKVEEPKPVTTSEAFKALEEGKEIESTYTGDKYKKENGLLVIQGKGFNNYCKCGSIAASELTNSWIILE